MAAITGALIEAPADRVVQIRNATAAVAATYIDWIKVPTGTRYAEIIINASAFAASGTLLPSILAADPVVATDTDIQTICTPTTAQTGHGQGRILLGPGVTGIADVLVWGTSAGADVKCNTILPRLMGVKTVVATGTATYTISVRFIGE